MIKSFKESLKSGPFRRLFKNTGLLISGDTVSAVLGVLTFAVSARALGTEKLGMLVLIDAYVRIVDKIMNFQSWQFMIKFGSDAIEAKDAEGFKSLVKFGTLVDGCVAMTGCLVAMSLAGVIGKWQGWDSGMIHLAMVYSLIIAFNVAGVPMGLLRIFDRFKLFSVQKSIAASIKFVGVLIAWSSGGGVKAFLWVWMVTEIFDYMSLTVMAWTELRKRGYRGIWKQPLKGITAKYPGLWNFLISTNLTGSVKVGFRELDILIVGKMLSLTDVSLYKLAKKLCASLDRLTNPLYQSLFPELTRAWSQKDLPTFKRLVKQMMLIMGVLSLGTWSVIICFGKPIIQLTAGGDFLGAYGVTVWYFFANVIAIATLPLAPMILAMGKANLSFWIQFLPTLIYFPILFLMIQRFGLLGAGYGYVLYMVLRVVVQWFVIETRLKHLLRPKTSGASA